MNNKYFRIRLSNELLLLNDLKLVVPCNNNTLLPQWDN